MIPTKQDPDFQTFTKQSTNSTVFGIENKRSIDNIGNESKNCNKTSIGSLLDISFENSSKLILIHKPCFSQ